MNKKKLLTIYTLLVCLVSVITLTCITAGLVYNALRIVAPQYTIENYDYRDYATNDAYIESVKNANRCNTNKNEPSQTLPMDEKAITAERERKLAEAIQQERWGAVHKSIESLPYFILFLILGLVHRRLFKAIKE